MLPLFSWLALRVHVRTLMLLFDQNPLRKPKFQTNVTYLSAPDKPPTLDMDYGELFERFGRGPSHPLATVSSSQLTSQRLIASFEMPNAFIKIGS